jgi:tRNA(fMet)-specific endonuclease VapC
MLIAVLRGDEKAAKKAKQIDEQGRASTTVINAYELLFGAKISAKREKNLYEARRLLSKLDIIYFTEDAAEKASDIHSELTRKGRQLDLRDIFIASMAIANGKKLVTNNAQHFSKIRQLKTERW